MNLRICGIHSFFPQQDEPLHPEQPHPQDEPPFFLLRMMCVMLAARHTATIAITIKSAISSYLLFITVHGAALFCDSSMYDCCQAALKGKVIKYYTNNPPATFTKRAAT